MWELQIISVSQRWIKQRVYSIDISEEDTIMIIPITHNKGSYVLNSLSDQLIAYMPIVMKLQYSDLVEDIKFKVQDISGYSPDKLKVTIGEREVEDNEALIDTEINHLSRVFVEYIDSD